MQDIQWHVSLRLISVHNIVFYYVDRRENNYYCHNIIHSYPLIQRCQSSACDNVVSVCTVLMDYVIMIEVQHS
jgi:hypothetical protein